MMAQELIQVLKSASLDEIAQIRLLLRIPDTDTFRFRTEDIPKNLGTLMQSKEDKSK